MPPPSSYEDAALRLSLPRKPWKYQRKPSVGGLLELGFGTTRLRLLRGTSEAREEAWCRDRGIELVKASLLMDDAESYWREFGMRIEALAPLSLGEVTGRVYNASSPARVHVFLWWHMALPAEPRVLELETESQRWKNDWREACKMLGTAGLRAR